jgi:hypothetical protein
MEPAKTFLARTKPPLWGAVFFSLLCALWFLGTPLAFYPVPWPDSPVFFIPGVGLLSWPIRWTMSLQAAFEPSYAYANFNTMPGLSLLLALSSRLGLTHFFEPEIVLRVISLTALFGWAWGMAHWLLSRIKNHLPIYTALGVWGIAGCTLSLDPVMRWGTLGIRTEMWILLFWSLTLQKFDFSNREFRSFSSFWPLSILLALAAYFHYQAVLLVLPLAVLLIPARGATERQRQVPLQLWIKRLTTIAVQTLTCLSPWLVYVLFHRKEFAQQLTIHFHRLAIVNPYLQNPTRLLYGLFAFHGSPEKYLSDAFFPGAVLFLLLPIFLSIQCLRTLVAAYFGRSRPHPAWNPQVSCAAMTLFWSSFFLWLRNPEAWFITLIHGSLWSWFCVEWETEIGQNHRLRSRGMLLAAGGYLLFSISFNFHQQRTASTHFNWHVYHDWMDSIDQQLTGLSHEGQLTLWQVDAPDILVALHERHPRWSLTRHLDIRERAPIAWAYGQDADAVIFSTFSQKMLPLEDLDYQGPERPMDIYLRMRIARFRQAPPFWFQKNIPERHRWVCQKGPFWADIDYRDFETAPAGNRNYSGTLSSSRRKPGSSTVDAYRH